MNCPECQRSIEHSAIFCQYCGHQVGAAAEPAPQEPDIQPALGSTIDLRRFRQAAPAAAAAGNGQGAAPAPLPIPVTAAPRHHHHHHHRHQRAHRHRHGPHPIVFVIGGLVLLALMRGGGPGLWRGIWPVLLIAGGINLLGGHSGRRFLQQMLKFAVIIAVAVLAFMILAGILRFAFIALVFLGLIWLASKIFG